MNSTWVAALALACVLALGVASRAGVGVAGVAGVVPANDGSEPAIDDPLSPTVEATARLATVRVAGRNCDGRLLGSGFLLAEGLVSSEHLVTDAVEAKIDQPIQPVIGSVERRSRANDLVLLQSVAGVELQLSDDDPVVGESLLLAGHADGGVTRTVEGSVLQVVPSGDSYGVAGGVLLVDARVGGGFSGGPVLDRRGDVVGVIKGYEPSLEVTVVVAGSTLSTWLDNFASDTQPTPVCGR